MKIEGKTIGLIAVAVTALAGTATSWIKATSVKEEAKASVAKTVNPAVDQIELLKKRLLQKEEDDDRRFLLMHRRMVFVEDRFTNPMVGTNKIRRAFDTASAMPAPKAEAMPQLQRLEVAD